MDDIRCRRPDRDQMFWDSVCLDEILPEDHPARMVWEVTGRLDLSSFYDGIKVRGDQAGRAATDPRMLLALWLYATIDGVGSGRELDRRCHCHDAYRWLRGGVPVNYHTLNDFRVANEAALDELLTQILTVLVSQKLVTVKRIAQDGTRVRASAGRKSFRGRDRLEELRDEMAAHVAEVKDPAAMKPSRREREAQARLSRIDQALETLKALEEAKAKQKNKPSKQNPPQASTTDPEARMMRMGDGGMRPGYNVQIAVDIQSRAVVGAEVTSCGSDAQESARMRAQVNERTGQKVHRHLIDGGFVNLDQIEDAETAGVRVYAPVPKAKKAGQDRYAPRSTDGPGVRAWRRRMGNDRSQVIYRHRASTVETVNADAKEHRGLRQFRVRGIRKVRTADPTCAVGSWSIASWPVYCFVECISQQCPRRIASANVAS
jgi:transposase